MANTAGVGFFDADKPPRNMSQMVAYIKLLNLLEIKKLGIEKQSAEIYKEAKACGLHTPTMRRIVAKMTNKENPVVKNDLLKTYEIAIERYR